MSKMSELDIHRMNILKSSYLNVDINLNKQLIALKERRFVSDNGQPELLIKSVIKSLTEINRDIKKLYEMHIGLEI